MDFSIKTPAQYNWNFHPTSGDDFRKNLIIPPLISHNLKRSNKLFDHSHLKSAYFSYDFYLDRMFRRFRKYHLHNRADRHA